MKKFIVKWGFDDHVFEDVVDAETVEQAVAEGRSIGLSVVMLGGGTAANVTIYAVTEVTAPRIMPPTGPIQRRKMIDESLPKSVDPPLIKEIDGHRAVVLPFVLGEGEDEHILEFTMHPETAKEIGMGLILCGDQALGNVPLDFKGKVAVVGHVETKEEAEAMMAAARKEMLEQGFTEVKSPNQENNVEPRE